MTKQGFYERVYEVVKLIPYGKVTSYGAVARFVGIGMSARMVGYAMNNCNKHNNDVPAHRVVNRKGVLTGKHHFGEPNTMQILLEKEGLTIIEDQIQDFIKHYWDPNIELV